MLTLGHVTSPCGPCLGLSEADKFNSAFLLRGRWPSRHSSRPALGAEGCLRRPTTTHTFTHQWPGQGPALVMLLLKVETHGFYSREASGLMRPCRSKASLLQGPRGKSSEALVERFSTKPADEDVVNSLKVWQLLWGNFARKANKTITRLGSMAPSGLAQVTWKFFVPLATLRRVDPKLAVGPPPPWGLAGVPSLPPSFLLPCLCISFLPSYSFYPVKL